MIWDVGIWNVPTDPIKNPIDQSLASLLHNQLCFAIAIAKSPLHSKPGSERKRLVRTNYAAVGEHHQVDCGSFPSNPKYGMLFGS
jgi:hypothetical protein